MLHHLKLTSNFDNLIGLLDTLGATMVTDMGATAIAEGTSDGAEDSAI